VAPDETTPTPETKSAPRQAKTARPRRATTRKTKTKAKTTRAKKRAAPVMAYGAAVGAARKSETARTLPALEMFEERTLPSPPPTAVAFVSFPGFDEAQAKLSATLKAFMDKVGSAINEAARLKVKTYVSDNIEDVTLDAHGNLTGDMRLRALTNIELDGDITAIIPMRPEGMDETLWAAHVDMVKQAQANRAELVKLAISAVSGLVTAIKPG
jgi:hypothetical protein